MTNSKVVYDLTHVAAQLGADSPTGIERVDAAFAHHFTDVDRGMSGADPRGEAVALHYGFAGPHLFTAERSRALLTEAESAWRASGDLTEDFVFQRLARWLRDRSAAAPPKRADIAGARGKRPGTLPSRIRWMLVNDRGVDVPEGAIYLNVSQFGFKNSIWFRWLENRPDVKPVFFIHDLLPLDCPEFFRDGYRAPFERVVETMARYAKAAIVSNETTGARIAAEMGKRGRGDLPIFSRLLPPPTAFAAEPRPHSTNTVLAPGLAAPYFVSIGTIEPRKNHLLLLHVWRDLARQGGEIPKLILIGGRGWENEQVLDLLDRSPMLRPHVAEASGLTTEGLRQLTLGARAVLSPSFEEGYGLPVVEALVEGTPVVASDIPVFREISQGRALFIDPTDGPGWRRAVSALAESGSTLRVELAEKANGFVAPTWPAYFADLEIFLNSL